MAVQFTAEHLARIESLEASMAAIRNDTAQKFHHLENARVIADAKVEGMAKSYQQRRNYDPHVGKDHRTDKFNGKDKVNFTPWSMDIEMMLRGRGFKFVGETLDWIKEQKDKIEMNPVSIDEDSYALTARRRLWTGDDGVEHDSFSRSLYGILILQTSDQAKQIVGNGDKEDGINAWRRLVNQYDPKTMNQAIDYQKKAMKLGRVKSIEAIMPAINELEDLIRKYNDNRGDGVTFDETTKICILYQILPETIENTLRLENRKEPAGKVTYEYVKSGVISWLNSDTTGRVPMDLGALPQTQPGGSWDDWKPTHEPEDPSWHPGAEEPGDLAALKGKGKGKGKGKEINGECYNCGKWGHRASECPKGKGKDGGKSGKSWSPWSKGKGSGKYSGKSYSKGYDKGKGFGKWGKPTYPLTEGGSAAWPDGGAGATGWDALALVKPEAGDPYHESGVCEHGDCDGCCVSDDDDPPSMGSSSDEEDDFRHVKNDTDEDSSDDEEIENWLWLAAKRSSALKTQPIGAEGKRSDGIRTEGNRKDSRKVKGRWSRSVSGRWSRSESGTSSVSKPRAGSQSPQQTTMDSIGNHNQKTKAVDPARHDRVGQEFQVPSAENLPDTGIPPVPIPHAEHRRPKKVRAPHVVSRLCKPSFDCVGVGCCESSCDHIVYNVEYPSVQSVYSNNSKSATKHINRGTPVQETKPEGPVYSVHSGKAKELAPKAQDREEQDLKGFKKVISKRRMKYEKKRENLLITKKEEEEIPRVAKAREEGQGSCWSFGEEKKNRNEGMNVLTRHSGKTLNALGQDMWQSFKDPLIIDSGAAETVLPIGWAENYAMTESPGSKIGEFYQTADGTPIYNEGQKTLKLVNNLGQARTMTFQCAQVSKALGSVSKICSNNNRVVFDDDGSYIENKDTGERLWLEQRNGVYVLDMMIAPQSWTGDWNDSPFVRPDP